MPDSDDLRCFCHLRPRLAIWGTDSEGQPFLHIKVFKAGKVYGEIIITGPIAGVKLRCRECFRWHRVNIRDSGRVALELDRSVNESYPVSR